MGVDAGSFEVVCWVVVASKQDFRTSPYANDKFVLQKYFTQAQKDKERYTKEAAA